MKFTIKIFLAIALLNFGIATGQNGDPVIESIVKEATQNSHLEKYAHHLLDVIGPRLVGTPELKKSHDWIVETYKALGIEARNEQWGEWRGWQRGITHIDMVSPRTQSLIGMQLAWSPSTTDKGVSGGVAIIPDFENKAAFESWLPSVKGKFVMSMMKQPTGRPDYNWEEWATEESFANMKNERDSLTSAWSKNLSRIGYNYGSYRLNAEGFRKIEEAGAVGVLSSRWSKGFGANRIFNSYSKTIPTIDLRLEDYTMLYRMVENGTEPVINLVSKSKELGNVPTFNTIGEIKGSEKPNEYVMLSAHLDTWDGATGATDNGTGTIVMMEAMRLLKKFYPNPKRTILVGHWSSEEQGLNGSRAFVEDHPDIVNNLQALFNQDNGTGRVTTIDGSGFLYSYEFINRWLEPVPRSIKQHIETNFPGMPTGGGSDHSSFLAAEAPGFRLSSLSWNYNNYTWHTNIDTYDKIVFDDVRNNAILTAILAYMASEDNKTFPREKRVMPISRRTGKQAEWPTKRLPNRKGGQD